MTTIIAPFYLYQFGLTAIPGAQGSFAFPAQARKTGVKTLGGSFDAAGTDTAGPELPYALSYTGLSVHATDTTQIRIELDSLRAQSGQLDRLWLHTADGYDRWCMARLVNVSPTMTATDRATVQFNLQFDVRSRWHGLAHGGTWTFDTGHLFDNGLYFDTDSGAVTLDDGSGATYVYANGGNADCDTAGITITAQATPITYFRLSIADVCEWEYTGTIAAYTSLVIDCQSKTVLNNGVDAWNDFHTTAGHHIEPWFRLASGNNSVVVWFTGGGSDSALQMTYSDAWS